jgi:hypothetical protein
MNGIMRNLLKLRRIHIAERRKKCQHTENPKWFHATLLSLLCLSSPDLRIQSI